MEQVFGVDEDPLVDDEFLTSEYKGLRDIDGWQRKDPWGGSSTTMRRPPTCTISPTCISTLSSLYTSRTQAPVAPTCSFTHVFTESEQGAIQLADDGRAETQSRSKSALDI